MKSKKIVLVTGGDKGIGCAITRRMAEEHGKVVFTYNHNRTGAEELLSERPELACYQCNLRDRRQVKEMTRAIVREHGTIDILINNAGYDNDAIFAKMDEEQWDSVLDINLRALYNVLHPFVEPMKAKNWGRIVNLTSIAGFTGAFGKSNYATAKAGMVGLTKSLAMELGGNGITVNAIAPGAIHTDMLMRIPEKYRARILENIPAKRFGKPDEVADLASFLVSDHATYINGQTIHINGGSYM